MIRFTEFVKEESTTSGIDMGGASKKDTTPAWTAWKKKKNKAQAPEGMCEEETKVGWAAKAPPKKPGAPNMHDVNMAKSREHIRQQIKNMEDNKAAGHVTPERKQQFEHDLEAAKNRLRKLADRYGRP